MVNKMQTDADVKKKAVRLVVSHLRRKVPDNFIGVEQIEEWISETEKILDKSEFNVVELFEMRKLLNDVIERTGDNEIRLKLRDSWFSLGKALDKKVKRG